MAFAKRKVSVSTLLNPPDMNSSFLASAISSAPLRRLALGLTLAVAASTAWTHGDVVPQSVDTSTLPQLGKTWLSDNPYSEGRNGHAEALRIGASAYNQNCARCHGLEAISGGVAPDLRKIDDDCTAMADPAKKKACLVEIQDYYQATVRYGRTRDGRVYMPPFDAVFTQEAVWAIKTYLESRRDK